MADDLPGFVASAVVLADDGLSVAKLSRDPSVDAETTSAYLGVIVKSNLKAIKLLAGDQVTDDILITTDKHYFLIRHVQTKPCFLFLMAKRTWKRAEPVTWSASPISPAMVAVKVRTGSR